MSAHPKTVRLAGLSGSLRKGSFSSAILNAFRALARDEVEISVVPLHDIPIYNQDEDGTYHGRASAPPVEAFRREIAQCDGIIIVSPEYNYGIPGMLKNALDWASRPGYASPLRDKPVLTATCSPGILGGVRAHEQLRETLVATLARPVVRPDIVITSIKDKLADGILTCGATQAFLENGITDLLAEIGRMKSS